MQCQRELLIINSMHLIAKLFNNKPRTVQFITILPQHQSALPASINVKFKSLNLEFFYCIASDESDHVVGRQLRLIKIAKGTTDPGIDYFNK